ncbi:uncharacterized protein B0I36DRAFT_351568 [Microdochium trichocladiopsis]|uniref:Zn(2)-C6 fungal-type domain-containing protein n=1 Tax=Microdochium trichocladiopsis TaxID=1682393 RepID=A0A9P9BNW3_9PEZI|nr:uncharacterized protein B0I36DRAFT_351568 [Microdochium trichocladiopsis]KAH7028148.1 hypothetical protein B0I36DRAFT_351568 [Microdochium trichocladiopsis]
MTGTEDGTAQLPLRPLTGRTYHSKSRAGCFTCKRRHVRCDEAQPTCSSCKRLLLRCEYPAGPHRLAKKAAPAKQLAMQRVLEPRKPSNKTGSCSADVYSHRAETASVALMMARGAQISRPLWTADDSARAVTHAAFATFDPVGFTREYLFAGIVPRESLYKDYYRYVCLAVRDLSKSTSTAVRAMGFGVLGHFEHLITPTSGSKATNSSSDTWTSKDKHLISAVGNYARALATFRDALPDMAPPDIAYATMCFAVLELLMGNFGSRNTICAAGVAVLRPYVVSPREARPDGAVRYGLHVRFGDSRALCNIEAVATRFAAYSVLEGLAAPPPVVDTTISDSLAASSGKKPLLPTFHIPDILPSPAEVRDDGKKDGVLGLLDFDSLRRQWEAFHGILESWLLSRYWVIAIGNRLDAAQHLDDEARLRQHAGVWRHRFRRVLVAVEKEQQQRAGQQRSQDDTTDATMASLERDATTIRLLSAYLHCFEFSMAATDCAHLADSSAGRGLERASTTSSAQLGQIRTEDVDAASLVTLACLRAREINGFSLLGFADVFLDLTLLPVIHRQATRQVRATRMGSGVMAQSCHHSGGRDEGHWLLSAAAPSTRARELEAVVSEQQLALCDLLYRVAERSFEEHEGILETVTVAGGPSHSRSTSSLSSPTSSTSSPSRAVSISSATASHTHTWTPSDMSSTQRSCSSSPSSPPSTQLAHVCYQKMQQQQYQHQHDSHYPHGNFQALPLLARKELALASIRMHIDSASAALRDGLFYARVVA